MQWSFPMFQFQGQLTQLLHPSSLPPTKVRLGRQVEQRFVISENSGVLSIQITPPTYARLKHSQEFLVRYRPITFSRCVLGAEVFNRMQLPFERLQQHSPHGIITSVRINNERLVKLRKFQNWCGAQLLLQQLKTLLMLRSPLPILTLTQQIRHRRCMFGKILDILTIIVR